MMTNVDFEGFNDWTDDELIEARDTINVILDLRKKAKIFDALKKVENAMVELQKTTEGIEYFEFSDNSYSLADIFEVIKIHYKKGMM